MKDIYKRLEEIEARVKDAAPGPWHHDMGNWEIETHSDKNYRQAICSVTPSNRTTCHGATNEWSYDLGTPEFIAQSREDIPWLLNQVRELQLLLNLKS